MPKYSPIIDADLLNDIFKAQKAVKKTFKNKEVTSKYMEKLIRSWRGELGYLRRKGDKRLIRCAELILAFAQEFHKENLRKYESYRR